MIDANPIEFLPYLKSVIWGGSKICAYKGLEQTQPNIGESWEISAVPGHESIVATGKYKGQSITSLIDKFGEDLLGNKVVEKYGNHFPLLIKIIDAHDNLSIQVHPDDSIAGKRHNSLGKSEMWYIIDADKNAKIYSGLKMKITPEEYEERIHNGTITETLAQHDSSAGDVFFLPAGRVHAIGAGNLLAEIQESSDITYRIYDYNRRDATGNLRELHTELAKEAIDYNVYDNYKSPCPPDNEEISEIGSCEHFTTKRIIIDGFKEFHLNDSSFQVMMCLEGEIKIITDSSEYILTQGHTVLIPAVLSKLSLRGKAKLLLSGFLL